MQYWSRARETSALGVRRWRELRKLLDEKRKYAEVSRTLHADASRLVESHFSWWSSKDHVNYPIMKLAVSLLNEEPSLIVETGTSAWGTDSTRLWDSYIRTFGGEFWSIDISQQPSQRLKNQVCCQTHLEIGDSKIWLKEFAVKTAGSHVDLAYLDSFDLDVLNPGPAEEHGLQEWNALRRVLHAGSLVLIDDTPASMRWFPPETHGDVRRFIESTGRLPGKGSLIFREVQLGTVPAEVISHEYSLLLRMK